MAQCSATGSNIQVSQYNIVVLPSLTYMAKMGVRFVQPACALLLALALLQAIHIHGARPYSAGGLVHPVQTAASGAVSSNIQPATLVTDSTTHITHPQPQPGNPLSRRSSNSRSLTAICPSGTFEWPKGSSYCWIKRESNGVKQGPGGNVFAASNVVLDSSTDKLSLKIVKKGTKTSCGEVTLDRSLGFGDYVWQVDTDPDQMHPSVVGASFMYADDNREFDIVYSKWGNSASRATAQYVMHPTAPGSQLQFYAGTGGKLTHRLRWSGSASPSQVQFETWTATGTLLVSWTAQSGTNFIPGDERVRMNHWISNQASIPSSSTYTLSCFSFCPLGQESQCSTPLGQKPGCPPVPTPPKPSPSPSPSPVVSPSPSPSPPPTQLPPCPPGQFRWPKDKGDYCWYRRDSGGARQGPGNNIFRYQNANVDGNTDALVLTVGADAGGVMSCGEVFLNRSLGFGDYVWTVQTDPSLIHHNLVGSPFIYADDTREFDIEYSRWGMPDVQNSQFVVQPYTTNPPNRFNLSGEMFTHRMRWSGGSVPGQVQFETWSVGGQQVQSWTNTGGNNFTPGDERVHINFWMFSPDGVPATNYFVVACFNFCPLGDKSCGAYGTRPIC